MTSNQIAFESAMIQKQANEWLAEHNSEMREETQRHNKEMETLQQNAINAQEHGNRIQENWNKWQEQWNRDYQAEFKKQELANEEERIAIQEKLAKLEELKTNAQVSYQAAQEANLTYMQGIASDQLALDTSFKEWQKEFSAKQYELNEYQAQVRNKEVEYNKAMQHEQNIIASNRNIMTNTYNYALLNWEREKTNRSLENALAIGRLNYLVGMENVNISKENLKLYEKKVKAENFQSYSSALFGRSGIVPGTTDSFSKIIPFVETIGGKHVSPKTIKQAEEFLFKD